MSEQTRLVLGFSDKEVAMLAKYGNRHGLIAGATGTGKTVTLQTIAEGFSDIGVPVFMADVKGDLSGLCQAGGGNSKVDERLKLLGIDNHGFRSYPILFWDMFAKQGHPVRTTVSEMGPLLLSRLLGLNETQEGVLNIAFKLADDDGLLLLDFKDLRAMLAHVGERASELTLEYGNVSSTSVGAIQRQLLVLEEQGGEMFFAEPALELNDLMRTATNGRGYISILAADQLMQNPRLYSTFLLWLLSELFEELPEVGDMDKPKLVFFFDEAHLLFNDAPPILVEKVEQVVRLIRSKGVGIYFVTQNPIDIPDRVLGQLGNRVQHALRAYTPRDQKAVASAAETFRPNPEFKTEEAIVNVGVGEALVSCLEEKGVPMVVQKTLIVPPHARIGPCDPDLRKEALAGSPVAGKYDQLKDRESAYERLRAKPEENQLAPAPTPAPMPRPAPEPTPRREPPPRREPTPRPPAQRRSDSPMEAITKSVLRSAGSQLGRQLVRGILGGLLGKRR